MARITVEDCLDKVDNRFSLVVLVAKRAKQLVRGADYVGETCDNKVVVKALREVAGGKVRYAPPESGSVVADLQEDLNR